MYKQRLSCVLVLVLLLSISFILPQPAFSGSPKPVKAHQTEHLTEFNTQTSKYHKPSCRWAQRCTRHCIKIPVTQALKQGGVPCKVCGG
jgi:hypothetical protein